MQKVKVLLLALLLTIINNPTSLLGVKKKQSQRNLLELKQIDEDVTHQLPLLGEEIINHIMIFAKFNSACLEQENENLSLLIEKLIDLINHDRNFTLEGGCIFSHENQTELASVLESYIVDEKEEHQLHAKFTENFKQFLKCMKTYESLIKHIIHKEDKDYKKEIIKPMRNAITKFINDKSFWKAL